MMTMPAPVESKHKCPKCGGTGADLEKTAAKYRRESSSTGYIRCWNCSGNGLDPMAFFRFSESDPVRSVVEVDI
jgi:hypothetical protein